MVFSRESVRRRTEKLREYAADIRALADRTFDDYMRDRNTRFAAERVLFLIAENIFDVLDHVLTSRFDVVSDNYEDILTNAFGRGIIGKELYDKLKGLGGFRNVLAQEYLDIRDRDIYDSLLRMKDLTEEIIRVFERLGAE